MQSAVLKDFNMAFLFLPSAYLHLLEDRGMCVVFLRVVSPVTLWPFRGDPGTRGQAQPGSRAFFQKQAEATLLLRPACLPQVASPSGEPAAPW